MGTGALVMAASKTIQMGACVLFIITHKTITGIHVPLLGLAFAKLMSQLELAQTGQVTESMNRSNRALCCEEKKNNKSIHVPLLGLPLRNESTNPNQLRPAK